MKQNLRLFMLTLLCAVFSSAWGQTTIASGTFDGKNGNYTTGWTTTGTGITRNDCIVIYEGENITSPTVDLTGYDKIRIEIKARRFGTLTGSKATIDASIDGTSVGTTDATGTNASASLTDIEFTPTSDMTAVSLVFICTNATAANASKPGGAGINSITIVGERNNDVATPVFSLAGGTYPEEQSVTISCETNGATIHYTTDGTDPTASSTVYSGAITISETTTLKAIAIKNDVSSGIAEATYTISGEEEVEDGIFDFTQNLTYGSGLTPSTDNGYITEPLTWTAGNVVLVTDGKYRYWERSGNNQLRIGYATSTLTLSVPEGKVITEIVFTAGDFRLSTETGSLNSKTWTGKANSVVFTTSGTTQLETITVTYGDDDGEFLDPQLSINNVDLYDDSAELEITTLSDGDITFTYEPEGVVVINYDETTNKYIVTRCEEVYEGSTTVTAEQAGTDTYNSAITTFDVTVYKKSPNVTLDDQYIGEIGNINMYVNTSKEMDFYTEAASEFSFTSSDESIATVEMSETDDMLIINAVGVGTATITYTGAESMVFEPVELTFTVTVKEDVTGLNGWYRTDLADLAPDDVFVIVGTNADGSYAMSNDKGTNAAPDAIAVTLSEDKEELIGTVKAGKVEDNIKWNISGNSSGYTFYPNGNDKVWLYSTTSNNGVRVGTGNANLFTLSTEGYLTVTVNNEKRYVGIYSSQDWRSYTSINSNITGQSFAFYKKYGEDVIVPTITVEDPSVEVPAEGGEGTIIVNYTDDIGSPEIRFFDEDGETEVEQPEWIVTDLNDDWNIEYIVEENTENEERIAYLKVFGYGPEDDEVYSDLITISQAAFVVDYADIPFEFNGGQADIETTAGLTHDGVDTRDYGTNNTKLKFNNAGDWMILKLNPNEDHGVLSLAFDIKANGSSGEFDGVFTVQTSVDGETYTDLGKIDELTDAQTETEVFEIASDVKFIKWIFTTKVKGNFGLGNIVLKESEVIEVTFAKKAEGYSTLYYGTTALNIPEGVKAYTYKVDDNGKAVETAYESIIPKGSAVVVELEDKSLVADGNYTVNFTTVAIAGTAHTDNMLYGFDEDGQQTVGPDSEKDYYFYKLSLNKTDEKGSIGFYWNNSEGSAFTMPAHKAYLAVEKTDNGVSAFSFEGMGTDINGIFANGLPADGVYTLTGVRVNSDRLQKGIYIVNGKKVVIK